MRCILRKSTLFLTLCAVLLAGGRAEAMSYGTATVNNKTCDTVTWTDANGKARSVALVRANGDRNGYKGGYIERYTYSVGNTAVPGMAYNAGQEEVSVLGCAVDHYASTAGCSKSSTTNATTTFLLQGASHCIWEFAGTYNVGANVGLKLDFMISEGSNDVLW